MPDARLVDSKASFSSFANILDARLLRALADLGFARPTLVQSKAIPLALENRDILARARTGSGKTAAYCIPVVQKILSAKSVSAVSVLAGHCPYEWPSSPENRTLQQARTRKSLALSSLYLLASSLSRCLRTCADLWLTATKKSLLRMSPPVPHIICNGMLI